MAEHNTNSRTGQNSLTISLSLIAGLGVILMITAAAIGVTQGTDADTSLLNLLFVGGLFTFLGGSIAWGGVVRPWENFDDINVGTYTGHHHDEDHHDEVAPSH